MIKRLTRAVDERVGAASWIRSALNHVFPDHWSFMLGEVAAYSFVILVITGVYLTFFFDPSLGEVTYTGSYAPLDGVSMSHAYESVIRLSFDVRAGLVVRQIHHWAALVFLGAIVVHAARVFFTGAFRKPRELNWIIGVTMLLLALANGFLGYSLLDDLLSGLGLRIAYSIGESIPVVGTWLVSLVFGGEFPGDAYLGRFYILHVLVVPVLIAGALSTHLALVWRQKHTQFPAPGHTERNVVGSKLFPTYAARSLALFLALFAILAGLGGLAQINPVWLWGPYDPAATTSAAQPDWYVGWLEGALRLFPPWEIRVAGYVVPNPFFPGVLLPGLLFLGMYAYPFVERRLTGDRRRHELLDRPRDHPVRTGLGVGVITFLTVLFVAGSQDVIAANVDISVQSVVWTLRIAVLALPPATALVAWAWCRSLASGTEGSEEDRDEVHERWTAIGTVDPDDTGDVAAGVAARQRAADALVSAGAPPADDRAADDGLEDAADEPPPDPGRGRGVADVAGRAVAGAAIAAAAIGRLRRGS